MASNCQRRWISFKRECLDSEAINLFSFIIASSVEYYSLIFLKFVLEQFQIRNKQAMH